MISSLNSQRPCVTPMVYQRYQAVIESTSKQAANAYQNVLKITEYQGSKLPQATIGQNIDFKVKD